MLDDAGEKGEWDVHAGPFIEASGPIVIKELVDCLPPNVPIAVQRLVGDSDGNPIRDRGWDAALSSFNLGVNMLGDAGPDHRFDVIPNPPMGGVKAGKLG